MNLIHYTGITQPCLNIITNATIVGTGSTYDTERAEEWRDFVKKRLPCYSEKINRSVHIDLRMPVEHLENIRAVFNPSISELAHLFSVSRQCIYKWLAQDSHPESHTLKHIVIVSQVADRFKNANVSRINILVKMKAFDGRSLLELLKMGQDCKKQIEILINEGRAIEMAYQRSGIAQSKTKSTRDWVPDVSIPAYREDS